MTGIRSCPACQSAGAEVIHQYKFVLFDDHPLSGECDTAVCHTCGLAFNQRTSPAEAYVSHYAALSKYATPFSPLTAVEKFTKLADIFVNLCPDKSNAILDVGCGAGGFLAKLKRYGYHNLSAMDPTPACIDGVQRELGIEAKVGVLASPPFQPSSFDVVISTGVLEHLLYPVNDLKALRNLLKPGGAVFIVVPDASRYVDFLDAPFQDFNIEHINHFSPNALNALFARQGWRKAALGQDVLTNTPKWNEPVIYGLFSPVAEDVKLSLPGFDGILTDKLKAYIYNSSELLAKIDQYLQRELSGASEVLLWGAGQTASLLLSQTVLSSFKIRAVIDSNPAYAGRRLTGATVGGPELKGDFNGSVVVATIREYQAVERVIREKLKWENKIISIASTNAF